MTRTLTLDFPQITRTAVGFDKLFKEIERSFASSQNNSYPPYNVVQINDDEWMVAVAVAGFGMDNLDITLDKNLLTIEGVTPVGDENVKYLHKGIGNRNFRRQFTIADHIEVSSATLDLGILYVHFKRNVPEELQPKKITIVTPNTIEG
jgi:molecular chaperone IbpA